MNSKVCTVCGEFKILDDFYSCKTGKLGKTSACKQCTKRKIKEYREKNPDAVKASKDLYYLKNKEVIIKHAKEYRIENIDKVKTRAKKHREENIDRFIEKDRIYRENNIDKINQREKEYYQKNKEYKKQQQRRYSKTHKEDISKNKKLYHKKNKDAIKYKKRLKYLSSDRTEKNKKTREWFASEKTKKSDYYIKHLLRSRVAFFLRANNIKKDVKTELLIGCSYDCVVSYLKDLGYCQGIHDIDHILPLAIFDIKNKDHKKIMFHYTNLRPEDPQYNRYEKKINLLPDWKEELSRISNIVSVNPEPIILYLESKIDNTKIKILQK